jgi:hypothetical protein
LEKLFESLYSPPYNAVLPFKPIAEYPPTLVFNTTVYSTKTGIMFVVAFVNRPVPAEYVRPVMPVDCVVSVVPHVIAVSDADAVMVCKDAVGVTDNFATVPIGPVGPVRPVGPS